jgi:hypothetical protein
VPVYRRYERAEPGELLHLDVKKLGRIVTVGHRITNQRRTAGRGLGWEYVHVAIDDASRVAYAQILNDEQPDSAIAFLRAAVAYLREWSSSLSSNAPRLIRAAEHVRKNKSAFE